MVAALSRLRVDERAMGAGTTVRFALLLVSSVEMTNFVVGGRYGQDTFGCLLASGADLNHSTDRDWLISGATQHDAYQACVDRYAPLPPWWVGLAWTILLLAVASVLFWGLPAWKARCGRVVPLESIDRDGELRRLLEGLVAAAGLARVPRFVVDPAAASTGAVVFGRNRRPTVCLHGGLLARRTTDPQGFRAVLLHELAHIRNGDVTLTYATVAVWRVFIAAVLLPYAAWHIDGFVVGLRSPNWPSAAPIVTRGLLLTVFMVTLVYLARSDVLRSREVYADLAAVRWGADPRGWAITVPSPAVGRLGRALGSFAELWRTHPRWDLRRDALGPRLAARSRRRAIRPAGPARRPLRAAVFLLPRCRRRCRASPPPGADPPGPPEAGCRRPERRPSGAGQGSRGVHGAVRLAAAKQPRHRSQGLLRRLLRRGKQRTGNTP